MQVERLSDRHDVGRFSCGIKSLDDWLRIHALEPPLLSSPSEKCITLITCETHRSAHRHGVSDADVRHAVEHPIVVVDLDPDADLPKVLVVGPDRAGNVLEVILLMLADDEQLAVHAMPLRKKYHALLEGNSDD